MTVIKLPEPGNWRLHDEEASEHYGKPIYVYYGESDFKNGADLKKLSSILEPLYTADQVRQAIADALGGIDSTRSTV